MPDLLIELLSEEIPARMQPRASDDLRRLVTDGLVEAGLTYEGAAAFATPRRLCLTVQGLDSESRPAREERRGPRTDAPDKAVEGFLRATGLVREALERRADKKGEVFFAVLERPGRPAADIVGEVLGHVIRSFPWPKSMRWGDVGLRWVRPLENILCILSDDAGAEVVPLSVEGFTANDRTCGHRFMAPDAIPVTSFDDYAAKLRRACVLLDPAARADHIWADATNAAFANGLVLREDRGLLTEVAGLVEWPVVLMGAIEEQFLALPPEVLQTSMREHQKFFAAGPAGRDGGRITHFVTVANRDTADDGATILFGNRKVLAARLSDAAFFWENDLAVARAGLGPWRDALGAITFHARLGTLADRVARMAALAEELAPATGADPAMAAQAASLAKLDLASEMVFEFPELQGVMGSYYLAEAGHGPAVAKAAAEHYAPLGPSDNAPTAPVSVAVSLAEKIDLLACFWAIDEKPTGSKDPFALRRAALGVLRLILENGLRLPLSEVFAAPLGRAPVDGVDQKALAADLLAFLHDRLVVYLRDREVPHDVIEACLREPLSGATRADADDLVRLVARARALAGFLGTPDGENLVLGVKRASNILSQAEAADGVEYSFGPDPKLADAAEERALFDALDQAEPRISAALAAEDFTGAMAGMAALRGPIDAFFEAVQINADSPVMRRNRLNLLHRIRETCRQVADFSRLQGGGGA